MVLPFQLTDPDDPRNQPPPPPPPPPLPPPPPPPAPSGHEESYEPAPPPPTPTSDAPAQNWADTFGSVFTPPTSTAPVGTAPSPFGGLSTGLPDGSASPTYVYGALTPPTPAPTYTPPDLGQFVDTTPFQFNGGNLLDSGWFGDAATQNQQYQWWLSEKNKALQSGDMDYYNRLMAEGAAVDSAWTAYGQQKPNFDAYGNAVQTYNDQYTQGVNDFNATLNPLGEGFGRPFDPGIATPRAGYSQWLTPRDTYGQATPDPNSLMVRSDVARQYGVDSRGNALPQFQSPSMRAYQVENQSVPNLLDEGKYDLLMESHPVRTMLDAYEAWLPTRDYLNQQNEEANRYKNDPDAQAYFGTQGQYAYGVPDSHWIMASAISGFQAAAGYTTAQSAMIRDFFEGRPLEGGSQPRDYRSQGGVPVARVLDDFLGAAARHVPGAAEALLHFSLPILNKVFVKPGQFVNQGVMQDVAQLPADLRNIAIGTHLRSGQITSSKQVQADALASVQRFNEQHPWVALAASLPFDPWNYFGLGEAKELYSLGKAVTLTSRTAREALTAEEAAVLFSTDPSIKTMFKWAQGSNEIAKKLPIGNSKVRDAMAFRLSALGQVALSANSDMTKVWAKEIENLPEIVRRLGGSDAEVAAAQRLLRTGRDGARPIDAALEDALKNNPTTRTYGRGAATNTATPNVAGIPAGSSDLRYRPFNGPYSRTVSPQTVDEAVEAANVDLLSALNSVAPVNNPRNYGPYRYLTITSDGSAPIREATPVAEDVLAGVPLGTLEKHPEIVPEITTRPAAQPTRGFKRTVVSDGRVDYSHSATQFPWQRGKMTQEQANTIGRLNKAGFLTEEEQALLKAKKLTNGDAYAIIQQRAAFLDPVETLVAKGHNINVTDTGTVEDIARAAQDDALRTTAVARWDEIKPTFGEVEHPNPKLAKKGYQQVQSDASRLNVSRFQRLLRDHYDDLQKTSFRHVVDEILGMNPLLKADLSVSDTSVRGALDQALSEVAERIAHGGTPIDDVRVWQSMMHDAVFTDAAEQGAREAQSKRFWDRLDEKGRARQQGELDQLKQANDADREAYLAAKAQRQYSKADDLLRKMEARTASIRQWEPDHTSAQVTASPVEKAAAQQADIAQHLDPAIQQMQADYENTIATLTANGHPDPASDPFAQAMKEELDAAQAAANYVPSDPTTLNYDAAPSDATADVLGREARGEVPPATDNPVIRIQPQRVQREIRSEYRDAENAFMDASDRKARLEQQYKNLHQVIRDRQANAAELDRLRGEIADATVDVNAARTTLKKTQRFVDETPSGESAVAERDVRGRKPRGQDDVATVQGWIESMQAAGADVPAVAPANVLDAAERAMGLNLYTSNTSELMDTWDDFLKHDMIPLNQYQRDSRALDREIRNTPANAGDARYEELSNRQGDLLSEIDRLDREKPRNWKRMIAARRKEVSRLDDQLREIETRTARGGFDVAAGGGGMAFISGPELHLPTEVQGMLHWTEAKGRQVLAFRPEPKPVIDLTAAGWRDFSWRSAEEAGRYDAYMKKLYDYSDLGKGSKLNPANLGKLGDSAQVAKAGDVAANYFLKVMDRAYYGEGKANPTQFVMDHLRSILEAPTVQDIAAIDDSWLMTETGRENLRVLRRHGPAIMEKLEKGGYSPFVSLRGLQEHLPMPVDGTWDYKAMKQIDSLMTRKTKPADMDPREWARVKSIRNAVGDQWAALKQDPKFYDAGTNRWLTGDVKPLNDAINEADRKLSAAYANHNALKTKAQDLDLALTKLEKANPGRKPDHIRNAINALEVETKEAKLAATRASGEIDRVKAETKAAKQAANNAFRQSSITTPEGLFAILEPEGAELPLDIHRTAEDIGLDVAEREAAHLGYKPEDVDWVMRMMASVKGNMSPLWMGMNPGYYIRNATGNVTSHLIGAVNRDMHVGLNAFRAPRWVKDTLEEQGAGTGYHRWMEVGISGTRETDIGSVRAAGSQYLVPRAIEHVPVVGSKHSLGTQGVYHWMQSNLGDAVEKFSKNNLYTQEWGWTYTNQWEKRVTQKVTDPAAREALLGVRGHNQLTMKMEQLGLDEATRKMLRGQMDGAIGTADMKAYETTSRALRDYRMRNRLDGILDHVIPIHYWTTKNAMFVGRTAASRPGSIPAMMAGFDQWEKENRDLPLSMRTGLLGIPGKYVPFVGDHDTYYLRVSSFMNPAIFAVAKFADPKKWDLSTTSLPDRLDGWGALGVRNAYQAMGYRIGPQYQAMAEGISAFNNSALHRDNKWISGFSDASNWLSGGGYRPDLVPLAPYFQQLQNIGTKIPGLNMSPQQIFESGYQKVYGSPYSRYETTQMGYTSASMVQSGKISPEQNTIILGALADRQFDYDPKYAATVKARNNDPNLSDAQIDQALNMVRGVIDDTLATRSKGYAASIAGFGGKVWSQANQQEYNAEGTYSLLNTLDKSRNMPFVPKGVAGTIQMVARDWGMVKQATTDDAEYRRRQQLYGTAAAGLWMERNAPYLPAFWAANDTPDELHSKWVKDYRSNNNEKAHALNDEYYATQSANINDAAPYRARLNQIRDARDNGLAHAGNNMYQVDSITNTYNDMAAQVYADAWAHGVDLVGQGSMPKTSSTMRNRTPDQKHWLDVNDAMTAVEEREVGQEQRAWFIEQWAKTNNLEPFTYVNTIAGSSEQPLSVRVPNPQFVNNDGSFDVNAYNAAVKEAAQNIGPEYRSLVQTAIKDGANVAPYASATNPNVDDVLWQLRTDANPDLAKWQDDRKAARKVIANMPTGTQDQYDAKQAAILEFEKAGYGPYSTKHWEDTPDGTSGYQHMLYDTGTDMIAQWYQTLTPREKRDFQTQYPNAFNSDGKFIGNGKEAALTSEQVSEIVQKNNLGAITQGSPDGPERTRGAMENYLPHAAGTERIYTLRDELNAGLTTDQEFALNAINKHSDDNPDLSDRAYELKNSLGLSWKKLAGYVKDHMGVSSDDAALLSWINDQAGLTQAAIDSGAYDAREAWFNGLSTQDQQLLMQEDPKAWYPDATDTTSGGGGGTSSGSPSSGGSSTYSGGSSGTSGGSRGATSGATSPGTSAGTSYLGTGTTRVAVPAWVQQLLNMPYLTSQQRTQLQNMLMAYYGEGAASMVPTAPPPGTRVKTRPGFPEAAG